MDNKRSYYGSITKYKEIGKGAFAHVYECDYYDACFAFKEFIERSNVEKCYDSLTKLQEYNNDSRFVFPYKFIYTHPSDKYFVGYVMELLYKYEDLTKLNNLDYNKKIEILKKARVLVDVFNNKYNFIHCDLSPKNFMYNIERDDIKLIDFDISKDLKDSNISLKNSNILAMLYSKKNGVDKDVDMFMFNLTTYAILNNVCFYDVISHIMDNNFGCIENSQAIDILSRYDDIEFNTLKKEYVIDYL